MSSPDPHIEAKRLTDEYGNVHHLAQELARGGQGVVFRTADADLAIKQPLGDAASTDQQGGMQERFQRIRLLPLPPGLPLAMPLAILRGEPGYVMRLLHGMVPMAAFTLDGLTKRALADELKDSTLTLPQWLTPVPDEDGKLKLLHYSRTGSTRRRLFALAKCACTLARLHSAGLVYGDISPNNVFVGEGDSREVWLIDADNLRLELAAGGSAVYTPGYGAPEVVQGRGQGRPRTDCWAFAVLAFRTLSLCHPFLGRKVLDARNDAPGWDADEPMSGDIPVDPEEQAYAGHLAFIDDEHDTSNAAAPSGGGLPRNLVATAGLRRLFQETFGVGRTQPHRRPAMALWAAALTRAFDLSLDCPECSMSCFPGREAKCPYCGARHAAHAVARTPRWEMIIPARETACRLPHRLFHPFSFECQDQTECELELDFEQRTKRPVRGTRPLPPDLTIEFGEVAK